VPKNLFFSLNCSMPTELIHTWQAQGRNWQVLHKPSAAYLRTDGRTVSALGAELSAEEAIDQAYLAAEMFQINERAQEMALLPRLFEWPQSAELKAAAKGYEIHRASLAEAGTGGAVSSGHLVYAPFNHNAYVYLARAENSKAAGMWEFMGCFASAQAAIAALPALRERLSGLDASAGMTQPVRLAFERRHLSQKLRASLRTEAAVIAGTAVVLPVCFALAYGFQAGLKRWPWLLLVLCAVMFMSCAVALWRQRK
jgi:hypothetical protein